MIAKIEKELENPKVLKQILDQAVQDVESEFSFLCIIATPWLTDDQKLWRQNRCVLSTSWISSFVHHVSSPSGELELRSIDLALFISRGLFRYFLLYR